MGVAVICLPVIWMVVPGVWPLRQVGHTAVQKVATADLAEAVKANNQFAFNLLRQLPADVSENLSVAPVSLSAGLSMLHAGARGKTRDQIATALSLAEGERDVTQAFGALQKRVTVDDPKLKEGYRLYLANRLWVQEGYPLQETFVRTTRRDFQAEVGQVDFKGSCDSTLDQINAWVSEKTEKKIPRLLSNEAVEADTRLILTSAVYLRALWERPFSKKFTRPGKFNVSATKTVTVPYMGQVADFAYASAAGVDLLELPYEGEEASCVLLLPRKVDGLGDLEKSLTAEAFSGWYQRREKAEVAVSLPRFQVRSRVELSGALARLGMRLPFTGAADLTGISSDENTLSLSKILHQAQVSVNEAGTEATAATAVIGIARTMPVAFRVDHPFLFVILHKPTGAILFVGRVTQPEQAA